jgi:hypothetical protein
MYPNHFFSRAFQLLPRSPTVVHGISNMQSNPITLDESMGFVTPMWLSMIIGYLNDLCYFSFNLTPI